MCGILVLNLYCMACYDRHIMFLLTSILFYHGIIATPFCLLLRLQAIISLIAAQLHFRSAYRLYSYCPWFANRPVVTAEYTILLVIQSPKKAFTVTRKKVKDGRL
jgi:hypothetical protein